MSARLEYFFDDVSPFSHLADSQLPGLIERTGAELTYRGCDADASITACGDPAVEESLQQNTAEAVERGAFGAPTFLVGDELFFGNDRLDFVEEALAG